MFIYATKEYCSDLYTQLMGGLFETAVMRGKKMKNHRTDRCKKTTPYKHHFFNVEGLGVIE